MLAAAAGPNEYQAITPDWFAANAGASQRASEGLAGSLSIAVGGSGGVGQNNEDVAQWIVRLTPEATEEAGSVAGMAELLNRELCRFEVVRGLGLPGQVLVQADATTAEVRVALAANFSVAMFEANAYFFAQAIPNDPDFSTLTGLNSSGQFGATPDADIDAPEAWDENTGSTNVVVGVIDSGIDYTHPDLYLNIWINQGEIPVALRSQLVDTDADGRITFYDLNEAANGSRVSDLNSNSYIDAGDLFADPRWTDGVDTDRNSFVDDLVGWNFRSAVDEPFEPNNPQDVLGHGTHIAGTIGAIGNNSRGVTGINWRSSLMALKFLDDGNTGQTADAIASVNYATMMRTQFGESVRIINASWGQSGSESPALRAAIEASGQADMLFVAAAGNGNILGQGINLDREPFFPASTDLANVISVAASGPADELARFSNFGLATVDLAAPGIGVLSTLPGGRYGTANGTSMAAPHVAGVAALILAELPFATSAEVKQAILGTVDASAAFNAHTATGGRLNAEKAIESNVFAPRASLVSAANVTAAGGTENLVTVTYRDRQGIDDTTIGEGDLIATRQWGPRDTITGTFVPGSKVITNGGAEVTAIYRIAAPGGAWDPLDFGGYLLSVVAGQVKNANGLNVPTDPFGEFSVQVADPTVFYVNSFADAVDANVGAAGCATAGGDCTLRAAIQEANAASPAPRTIILDEGTFKLSLPPVPESTVSFVLATDFGCYETPTTFVSSDVRSGDLDVFSDVTIIGNQSGATAIDAAQLDRVFKVYPNARLELNRVTVTGGIAPDGGGILSAGELHLNLAVVAESSATNSGGGIAVFGGHTQIVDSTISENHARRGGGVFVCNLAAAEITTSTVMRNLANSNGGGLFSSLGGLVSVTNTTISQNTGGAVIGNTIVNDDSSDASLSADGRFVAFSSDGSNLVPGDSNGRSDVFVFDRQLLTTERVSVANDGTQSNNVSNESSISANGRFVVFESSASNLISDDTNSRNDVFVVDRQNRTVNRVSEAGDGTQSNDHSSLGLGQAISSDGRFVTFSSQSSNLVAGDTNGRTDSFVFDQLNRTTERISVATNGTQGNSDSFEPSISADGRFVAFESFASNLVPGDSNNERDIFVFDRQNRTTERVSVANDGTQSGSTSFLASISADGRFIVFSSSTSNLVAGDTNGTWDVFVFDRLNRTIERVSLADDGTQGNSISGFGGSKSISSDGRFVVFHSNASNFVPNDTVGSDVFLFDRESRKIERISTAANGGQANGQSFSPAISADGRFLAFESVASNLIEEDYNSAQDILVFDREQRRMELSAQAGTLVELENSTIAENQGTPNVSGKVVAHNSLFVRNSPDLGQVLSDGYNLADRGVASGFTAADLLISTASSSVGPLKDNGGPTWTHALLPGNPGIDAADVTAYPATDQLSTIRPQDGDGTLGPQPDIGAYEAFKGEINGKLFRDLDRDGQRGDDESGVSFHFIYLDANKNGIHDPEESTISTNSDDPFTPANSESGAFDFKDLTPATYWFTWLTKAGWSRSYEPALKRVSETESGLEGNSFSGGTRSSLSADGRFIAFVSNASNLVSGDTNGMRDIFVFDRKEHKLERASVASDGGQGNDTSLNPSVSADGRFVAFESVASNLVPGDTNGSYDVFVFDRQNRAIERISIASNGTQADRSSVRPSISADGRFVAFLSGATNLVPNDTNGSNDIFVVDRLNRTIERVSITTNGIQSNGFADYPSISGDGRFVAFESNASDLVPGDTNGTYDVFDFDRLNRTIERVSIAADGAQGNNDSNGPSISSDGNFIAFYSDASNLVPGDTNGSTEAFVFDRQNRSIERVSIAHDGTQGNGLSYLPSINADGRFVTFESRASNLVPDDTNGRSDVFIFDRRDRTMKRLGVAEDGTQGFDNSEHASISADGRFVVFDSYASNLVGGDSGAHVDLFVTVNRSAPGADSQIVDLIAGQRETNVDFGIVPDPGAISGRCFDDVIANRVRDEGEPARPGCTVYLDLNFNSRFDPTDRSTVSAADGTYSFTNLDAELEYRVGLANTPSGQTLVLPTVQDSGVWNVFLPAGGTITDRDFGLRPASTLGQFENGAIQGRLFVDQPGAVKPGVAGIGLFVDLDDDGVRDFDEPRTISAGDNPATPGVDESGQYSFTGLGTRPYTVRVQDVPANLRQQTPIGNSFARLPYSLASPTRLLGSPLDVVVADFNSDNWPDLATVVFDGNAVSILLNNGQGNFLPTPIDISLAPAGRPPSQPRGTGPIALVAGQFNGAGGADLAVANSFSSNVAILLDFNGSRFASETYLNVGLVPTGIASGDLESDGDLDLVVTNNLENASGTVKNVSLLRNNGQGSFAAIANPPSAGNNPSAVVTGHFNNDALLDLAIADFGTHPRGADLGDVRVLLASANGTFQSSSACGIGFGPSALTTADLNGDQKLDLAVANFLSDNVTVCIGSGSGTFQAAFTLSGGSGPTDIAAADIDDDDDLDLLITNGKSQKVGILRSRLNQGVFEFDPAESFGAAQFTGVTRLSFGAGDFDRDGDLDLAVASSERNELSVQTNSLVGGAQRRALNGVETIAGVNFAFLSLNLPPTLNTIAGPVVVNEDSGVFTVPLSGIGAGSGESQPIRVTVSSDNPSLFASATVDHLGIAATGSVRLTPADDQWGQAVVTVTVTDGGLDDNLETAADNSSFKRSFTVIVNPLDDPPTAGADDFSFLLGSGTQILDVLGNDSIAPDFAETLTLIFVVPPAAAVGTLVIENNRLKYTPAAGFEGSFTTQYFVSDGGIPVMADVSITINSPTGNPWFNAAKPLDVTGDGSIVADDALAVINFLNAFGSQPVPQNAGAGGPFYDVNGDRSVAAGDALDVINFLNAFGPDVEGEGEAKSLPRISPVDPVADMSGDMGMSSLNNLISLLALDLTAQPKRRPSRLS